MRTEIQERICDECGKKEQIGMVTQFGTTPFCGWITTRHEGVDGLTPPFDFCSSECLGKHFTLFKEVASDKMSLKKGVVMDTIEQCRKCGLVMDGDCQCKEPDGDRRCHERGSGHAIYQAAIASESLE